MTGYKNASRQSLDINPSGAGLGAIGHMGYFKRHAMPLWEPALEWLAAQSPTPSSAERDASKEPALPRPGMHSHTPIARREFAGNDAAFGSAARSTSVARTGSDGTSAARWTYKGAIA